MKKAFIILFILIFNVSIMFSNGFEELTKDFLNKDVTVMVSDGDNEEFFKGKIVKINEKGFILLSTSNKNDDTVYRLINFSYVISIKLVVEEK